MDEPKYVVCLQGVEGFVADFGSLELAVSRAKVLCPPGSEAYVLAPVKTIRRAPSGRMTVTDPEIEPSEGERALVHADVLKRAAAVVRR